MPLALFAAAESTGPFASSIRAGTRDPESPCALKGEEKLMAPCPACEAETNEVSRGGLPLSDSNSRAGRARYGKATSLVMRDPLVPLSTSSLALTCARCSPSGAAIHCEAIPARLDAS